MGVYQREQCPELVARGLGTWIRSNELNRTLDLRNVLTCSMYLLEPI